MNLVLLKQELNLIKVICNYCRSAHGSTKKVMAIFTQPMQWHLVRLHAFNVTTIHIHFNAETFHHNSTM